MVSQKQPIFEQKGHFKIDQSKLRLYEAISTVKAQFLHEQQNMVCDSVQNFSKISKNFQKFPKTSKILKNNKNNLFRF